MYQSVEQVGKLNFFFILMEENVAKLSFALPTQEYSETKAPASMSAKELWIWNIAFTSVASAQATMCVCKQLKDPANLEQYTNEPSLRMPVAC